MEKNWQDGHRTGFRPTSLQEYRDWKEGEKLPVELAKWIMRGLREGDRAFKNAVAVIATPGVTQEQVNAAMDVIISQTFTDEDAA
jgi:hypothetical protein